MRVKAFFNKSFFYLDSAKSKWLYILIATLFAYLFLVIFKPYGISEEMKNPENPFTYKFLFFFSIAVAIVVGLVVSQFLLRPILGFQKVTNKKYVLWFFIEVFIIWGIYFASAFIVPDLGDNFEKELSISFQLINYISAVLVLIFPFAGIIIYQFIKHLNEEIGEPSAQLSAYCETFQKQHPDGILEIYDENNHPALSIHLADFLFAESGNQYVIVYYLKKGKIAKDIVRNLLKNIPADRADSPVFQCHCGYAVNLLNISHMVKRENKNFLVFKQDETQCVPVSKSYLEIIKRLWRANNQGGVHSLQNRVVSLQKPICAYHFRF